LVFALQAVKGENMKSPQMSRQLSAVDAAFLYLERDEIPLHVAGVFISEAPIPFEEFVTTLESKLHLIPRYRQVVVQSPFGLNHPTWEWDPQFDIHQHVFQTRVEPPGGQAEMEALAGRILSKVMERSKPLWDIHLVKGLKDGRGAFILRLHHALADGISGEALLRLTMDARREGSRLARKPRFRPIQAPPGNSSFMNAIEQLIPNTIQSIATVEAGTLGLLHALLRGEMQEGLRGLGTVLPEFVASIERLPFNKPCGAERRFVWTECDLQNVLAIRQMYGGKVNDIVLTVLTRAIARYVRLHGETVTNRLVRVVCPVSLWKSDSGDAPGNRISFLPVALPLDIHNPVENLQAVIKRMQIMKSLHAADLVGLAASVIAAAPVAVQSLFWSAISQITLPVPLLNIICTNVPGPSMPLYAAGRRMLTFYPQVPTGYDLGVGVAVATYGGKLFYGFTADAQVAPDVGKLRDYADVSFQELCRFAGVKRRPLLREHGLHQIPIPV
jgi:diacylglycerol O-acyltransferase